MDHYWIFNAILVFIYSTFMDPSVIFFANYSFSDYTPYRALLLSSIRIAYTLAYSFNIGLFLRNNKTIILYGFLFGVDTL